MTLLVDERRRLYCRHGDAGIVAPLERRRLIADEVALLCLVVTRCRAR